MSELQPELEQVSQAVYSRRQALGIFGMAVAGMAWHRGGLAKSMMDWAQPEYDTSYGPEVRPAFDLDVEPIKGSFDIMRLFADDQTPGVSATPRGLLLEPLDMRIINKHLAPIKPYVDNPPVNVMGYIRTNNDFAVSTTVEFSAPVHVQLYGKVPKLMDDSRTEYARLDCELSDTTLRVKRYSDKLLGDQTREFRLPRASYEHTLDVQKIGGKLVFMVDGYSVGEMDEGGMFEDGTLWFGLNSLETYAHVSDMTFREIGNGSQQSGYWKAGAMRVQPSQGETLQGLVDARGFPIKMGSAVSLYPLLTDPRYAQVMLGGNYKILTIENAMKELYLMSMNGTWEPRHALSLIKIIRDHGILVHGHTAIYDKAMHKSIEQMPTETHADKMRVAQYIEDHIVTFGEEFGQYLYSCDVVNEAVDGFGPAFLRKLRLDRLTFLPNSEHYGVHLRDNVFARALGREWIALAFKTAAQVMPKTKLGLNEYGIESEPYARGKMVFDLADYIEDYGGRVDYIGLQTHIYHEEWFIIRAIYRDLLNEARVRGRKLRTSELDVTDIKGEVAQGLQYQLVLEEALRHPDVMEAFITWGSDDRYGSTDGRALPYDKDFREKLTLRMMRDTIRNFDPTK